MLIFKPIYLLLFVPAVLAWLAQWRLGRVYRYYLQIPNKKGKNGIEIANDLLSFYELNIPILMTSKQMVNYYNPQKKTLHFCKKIAELPSITSLGIVAHEIEHAVQEQQGFRLMSLRNKMAGVLAIIGQLSPLAFVWGMFFRNILLIYAGLFFLFSMIVFALLSLPLELNASQRALNTLKKIGLADQEESKMVNIVLKHAALTYFVGALQRIGTFLFILLILTVLIKK